MATGCSIGLLVQTPRPVGGAPTLALAKSLAFSGLNGILRLRSRQL